MDFVSDVADYGDTPEIYVSGIRRVTRISNGIARIELYVERETDEGKIERRVVASLLCATENMAEFPSVFAESVIAMKAAVPLTDSSRRSAAVTH